MLDYRIFSRIDYRQVLIISLLMFVSILVIASTSGVDQEIFWTPYVKNQCKWFFLGSLVYLFFASLDYRLLQKVSPIVYGLLLLLLLGLFFTGPIQNVQRWYRIPGINFTFQPSELAKLSVVIAMAKYLSENLDLIASGRGLLKAGLIVLIPFVLILKQPDLGTALVLYPITLSLFYLSGVSSRVIRLMSGGAIIGFIFISMMFLKILSHEGMRPFITLFLKDYQYERLNPNTYHQNASQMAIALGQWTGSGFRQSEFTKGGWLPAAHTDSVFAAFAEEYGLFGVFFLLLLFFLLVYLGFRVTQLAKDPFGRFLACGITVTLATHVFVNMGMMCGFLPITGVPLVMVTFGGSSVLSTMASLGILQSVYARRYRFL